MFRFICSLLYGKLDFVVLLSQKSHMLIYKTGLGRGQWGLVTEILTNDERHFPIPEVLLLALVHLILVLLQKGGGGQETHRFDLLLLRFLHIFEIFMDVLPIR